MNRKADRPSISNMTDTRDEKLDAALDAQGKVAEAKAAAVDTTEGPAGEARIAEEEARLAQADVDRAEIAARNMPGLSEAGYTGEPHGVVNDAIGGPAAERDRLEEAKKELKEG